ncbi:hypothetical protein BDV97DRAFT_198087 [Delphinella strobiligena]|nr:hypothetical protein BDV97DRAFT_198087 [Delphinella strobiligena]
MMSFQSYTPLVRTCLTLSLAKTPTPVYLYAWRAASSDSKADTSKPATKSEPSQSSQPPAQASSPKKKTQLELDEELRQKMSGLSGDGGESGIEYEDGQPVSMKRSVKNNMFRYI